MTENNVPLPEDEISILRNKVDEFAQPTFRRKLVGGYDEDDVVKYINSLRQQVYRSEEISRVRVEELTYAKNKVQNELETKLREAENAASHSMGVVKQLREEKAVIEEELEEARKSLADYKSKLAIEDNSLKTVYESKIAMLEEQLAGNESQFTDQQNHCARLKNQLEIERSRIKDRDEEIQELVSRLEKAEGQLENSRSKIEGQKKAYGEPEKKLGKDLEARILGVRSEMEVLYKKLDELEEQAKDKFI